MPWFEELFIEEAEKALQYHSGRGSGTVEVEVAPDIIILVDEEGTEVAAYLTEEEVDLTATANDIRLGTTAVTNDGVVEGSKDIPAYYTIEGFKKIPAGSAMKFSLYSDSCEYTKFQAIICTYNTSSIDSVSAEKVSINNKVYAVNSTVELSNVVVDPDTQSIDLSLVNDNDHDVLIRFFTYKEVY